jgi:glycosyltransferase involved in cell wall biosynthesis
VAVVRSLYEGFSLPAVEAMACATPLVTARAGALPEVVGNDGLDLRSPNLATSSGRLALLPSIVSRVATRVGRTT